jgi:hypothetical protein
MELLTPGIGLIIWQVVVLLHIILLAISWLTILTIKTWDGNTKLAWMLGTLFIPMIGSIVFFSSRRSL